MLVLEKYVTLVRESEALPKGIGSTDIASVGNWEHLMLKTTVARLSNNSGTVLVLEDIRHLGDYVSSSHGWFI